MRSLIQVSGNVLSCLSYNVLDLVRKLWGGDCIDVEHTCVGPNMQRPDTVTPEIRYASGKTLIAVILSFVHFCTRFLFFFFSEQGNGNALKQNFLYLRVAWYIRERTLGTKDPSSIPDFPHF